jgi:glutathione synthase/RimK-type ligase-like ATP-grasp enzyme
VEDGRRVAVVTCSTAVGRDEDEPLLLDALAEAGVAAHVAAWDDPEVPWSHYDAVVLRSTWNYPQHHEAFDRWLGTASGSTVVLNPVDVVRWNMSKTYLLDLVAAGVPVVPTVVAEVGQRATVPDDWADVVVKPAIGAGAQGTSRHRGATSGPADDVAAIHATGRAALLQPYVEGIDAVGETCVVFVGGRFSHAFRKHALLRDTAAQAGELFAEEVIEPMTATAQERAVADAALAAVPFDAARLLYARVDLFPTPAGPVVNEVELIEPSLFLVRSGPAAAGALAGHIAARLR